MPNPFAERLLDQAGGLLKVRNYASAGQLVNQALAIDPKNLRALSFGSIIAANSGRKDLALDLISQALKLDPNSAGVMFNAASIFNHFGQTQRARQLWERLNKLQPNSVSALWNLGTYHFTQD